MKLVTTQVVVLSSLNGEHLIPVEQISAVQMSAAQTVGIVLSNDTSAHYVSNTNSCCSRCCWSYRRIIQCYSGNELEQAINYALTGNPGGVKAKVFPIKDDDDKKVYITEHSYTLNSKL